MKFIQKIKDVTIIFLIMVALAVVSQEIIYSLSDSTYWFEYYEPKVSVVYIENDVEFSSNAEYKSSVFVTWYDTLFCKTDTGIWRGETQIFSDFKEKGFRTVEDNHWKYNYMPDKEDVIECKLQGAIVVNTPSTVFNSLGYTKSDYYQTEWFEY